MAEWVERIPAAIEKAEGLLAPIWAPGDDGAAIDSLFLGGGAITRTEVGLAKALWGLAKSPCDDIRYASHCDAGGCGYEAPDDDPVLRAFVEKVEAL